MDDKAKFEGEEHGFYEGASKTEREVPPVGSDGWAGRKNFTQKRHDEALQKLTAQAAHAREHRNCQHRNCCRKLFHRGSKKVHCEALGGSTVTMVDCTEPVALLAADSLATLAGLPSSVQG